MSPHSRRPRRVARDVLTRGPSAQLMAGMRHDLRTPMNAILSFAYLGRHAQDTQHQRHYFRQIEIAARALLDVFDGVIEPRMRSAPEPVAPEVPPTEVPAPSVATEALIAGLRVLVVDDHETNLEIARELLESAQVSVVLARSGAEAIERAAQGGLDAILMDLRMPGMDGIEATQRIGAMQPEHARIPVIALTANVSEQDRQRCANAGMGGFVGKPIDVTELFDVLAQVLGRRAPDVRSPSPYPRVPLHKWRPPTEASDPRSDGGGE